MGRTIHQEVVGSDMFPVKSLDHVVHTTLQDGGTTETLLCAYKRSNVWEHVQSDDMISVVRTAIKKLKLHHQGIDPDLVISHLLRAGGANALKLHGYDATTMKTFGRWTSLTFLQYIHN